MVYQKKRIDRKTYRRTVIMYGLICFCCIGLVVRLFNLQVINYEYYQGLVIDEITYQTDVNPNRGEIYDVNGKLLATNVTTYTVAISPQDIIDAMADETSATYTWVTTGADGQEQSRELAMNHLIAAFLSETLDVDYDSVIEKAAKNGRKFESIKTKVDDITADKIRAFISEYDLTEQIYLVAATTRYYPYSSLACHVLGFTNSEGVGIYGLESYYNNLLEGSSGRYVTAQDAFGNDMPFDYESYIDAEHGHNLITTLDVTIQNALETQVKEAYIDSEAGNRVTGIVMDVNTGAILGMATYPEFDLNDPYTLDADSQKELLAYTEGTEEYRTAYYDLLYSMWTNKAVTDTYIPGSTFKIVTTAMSLEENVVDINTNFYCNGGLVVVPGTQPVKCHKVVGHGSIPFAVGLQQSCNVVFMNLGQKLGTSTFYSYLNSFGYLKRTGIDLPAEGSSIILSEKRLESDPLSLAIYAFGQNFNVTPIQQLTAIASIANGGYMVTPHLLSAIQDADGNIVKKYETSVVRQVISSEVCETVATMLEEGVSGNGGARNAYVDGYKIAAKTGTSEKKDSEDKSLRIGSCVAFAPADDPQVAVILIVDEPMSGAVYGSVVAAPYVGNVMEGILPYLGVKATDDEETVTVSNYVGSTLKSVENMLSYEDIPLDIVEIVGSGDTITLQVPAAGSKINKESGRLILYTGSETAELTIKVPDLSGMSAAAANEKLINLGMNVAISGSAGTGATVVEQSITPGTYVSKGTIITIEVRHLDLTDD